MRCTAIILTLAMFTTEACRAQEPAPAQPPQPPQTIRAGVQSDGSSPAAVTAPAPAKGGGGTSYTSSPPARRSGGGFGSQNSLNPLAIDGDGNNAWLMLKRPPTSRPTEKGAYLGLSVSSVPTVLRDQLNLQRNVGLVVNFIEKDSPAEAAGFKQSDVLQKLDDQILIDTRQFAVLVRIHDVNQPIRFTIIRQAKPMEINAKVVEKDLTVLDDSGRSGGGGSAAGDSSPYERMMELMGESRANQAMDRANEAADRANEAASRTIEQLQRRLDQMNRSSSRSFGLESKDDQHTFQISDTDGHRTLRARDNTGKMLFEGPIDTDEQIDRLPADIKAKVKALPVWWPGKGPMSTQPFAKPLPALKKIPPVPPAPPAPPAPKAPPVPPTPPEANVQGSLMVMDQPKSY